MFDYRENIISCLIDSLFSQIKVNSTEWELNPFSSLSVMKIVYEKQQKDAAE